MFYGGLALLGWFFEQIGKWNEEKKSNLRDQVANEVMPHTGITSELIELYKSRLQSIGYNENQKYKWLSDYYHNREKKSVRGLLKKCPTCDSGYLRVMTGKYGKFLGCSSYPKCHYTKNIDVAKMEYKQEVNENFMNLFIMAYK